jgi:hypothetical protein
MNIQEALEIIDEATLLAGPITSQLRAVIELGKGIPQSRMVKHVDQAIEAGDFGNREKIAIDSFLNFLNKELKS